MNPVSPRPAAIVPAGLRHRGIRAAAVAILLVAGAVIAAPPAAATQPVLYDQMTLTSAPAAIRSHQTGHQDTEGYAADDFQVVEPMELGGVRIETTLVPGTDSQIIIHGDANGVPGAGVYFATNLQPEVTEVGAFQKILEFDLPTPILLDPGIYWLSVSGQNNGSPLLEWYSSGGGAPALGTSGAVYLNTGPGDCQSWSLATTCLNVNGKVSDPPNAVNLHFALLGPEDPNQAPTADAGGPYTVDEGSEVLLTGTSTDPDGDALQESWDLDGDLAYETAGQTAPFSAAGLDGPSSANPSFQACDQEPLCATASAIVNVLNVAPTATFANTSGQVLEGGTATLAFADAADVSAADTAAGFTYSFDCTDDGTLEATGSAGTFDCFYPAAGSFVAEGTIADKDGGMTSFPLAIDVLTPAQGIDEVADDVEALEQDGTLNQGQSNALQVKLNNAKQKLANGQENVAINLLNAFVDQVESFVADGILTAAEGDALIDQAEAIIQSIESA